MKTINKNINLLFILILAITFANCDKYDNTDQLVPLTVDQDESLPSISVNGTALHSEAFGNPEKTMVLVVHGGPGSDYRSLLNCKEFVNDDFYVIFYDQRGSGLSRRHDPDENVFNVQTFIDDLKAVIDYYKESPSQKVILIGHSWGAMLATALVNQSPEYSDGMILTEPGGLTLGQMEEYLRRSMNKDLTDEGINDMVYLDQFITGHSHDELDYKAMFQHDIGPNIGNPDNTPIWRFGAVCNAEMHKSAKKDPFDFTTNLGSFNKEVLFLYSERNEAYGGDHAEEVASPFTNVELKEVRNCGHTIIEFGWDDFYSIALPFLDQYK